MSLRGTVLKALKHADRASNGVPRLLPGFCRVAAGLLIAIPLFLLVLSFEDDLSWEQGRTVKVPSMGYARYNYATTTRDQSDAVAINVQLQRLDRPSGVIEALVSLSFPERWISTLVDSTTYRPVTRKTGDGKWKVLSGYENERLTVTFLDVISAETVQRFILLPQLVDQANSGESQPGGGIQVRWKDPLKLPAVGQGSLFPGDWYGYDGFVDFDLSQGLLVRSSPRDVDVRLPTVIGVRSSARFQESRVSAAAKAGELDIIVRSNWQTRVFSYFIAFSPLFLLVVAWIVGRIGDEFERETWVVLVVGVLSIFPIRSLAVPSDLAGVTRLDLILACDLAVAMAFMLLSVSRALRRSSAS